ncbi:LEM domain-containing protein 1 isoform X2 [Pangasianodon hypophthalmus]|uniref:LEM domain-containing protein 1 isoform X2 n=1 Tax=Pangasianodon hypophthalmus TaxID=310915 RepID=UPI002307EE72|nr:LEM domain-containing protein 1 isoform X2 [Pangasianodon hypophthalmus]
MPVFVENPTQFSKQRLKSELISHSVEVPPADSAKQLYLEVYMKHVGNKNSADFSSDEEEQVQDGNEEEERGEDSDMVDLSLLTDDQLKCKLLQYGVKAGPIVASTRALYERKLHRMMTQHSQHSVNNKDAAGKYSDSEEEESGSEQLGPESVSHTDPSVTPSTVGLNYQSKETFYPQCFVPPVRQIENRLSPQSKSAETERSYSQTPVASRAQWLNKSTTNVSFYLTPECSPLQKQTTTIKPAIEAVADVLMEMFPDTALTPTGITATKRRSIKGAAGRPVQFKYPETLLSPTTLERREIQQRLVPLWVQIAVFLLVAALLYFIYISMEEPLENPFGALLNGLSKEPSSDDLALVPNSQDTHT